MSTSLFDRASAYLTRVPAAISGAGGHDATFKAACALVHGFDMAPGDALPLLQEWNQKCEPPWGDADLRHKLVDADKARSIQPRGYLLGGSHRRALPSLPQSTPAEEVPKPLPQRSGFVAGTPNQLLRLAESRPYHIEGLKLATNRGLLVFGRWREFECYGVTDSSGRVLELRRVDGNLFPAAPGRFDERKSHAVVGSQKQWPVGILETRGITPIALVEGIPDFLEAHFLMHSEQSSTCFPVAMLSSSPKIHNDALDWFLGKHVRIFAHADEGGLKGALKWQKQLLEAHAMKVDIFDFSHYRRINDEMVKDLWEFVHDHSSNEARRVLP